MPLPLRDVTVTIRMIADSDERARQVVDEMVHDHGSGLDFEIQEIREVPVPTPPG